MKKAKLPARRVALLIPTTETWGKGIVSGICDYVRKHQNWQIFIEPLGINEEPKIPKGWKGEGIIARVSSKQAAKHLLSFNVPIINISSVVIPGMSFPTINTNADEIASMAIDHFAQRGFKNYAYLSLQGADYISLHKDAYISKIRNAGYQEYIHSLPGTDGAEPDWNLDLQSLSKWLMELPKPVSVFTWNASLGRMVIYACQRAGISIPKQVSLLCGNDDQLLCEISDIPMSAIIQPTEQLGVKAAEMLDLQMNGKPLPSSKVLLSPIRVMTRDSTDTLAIEDPALFRK